MSLIGNWHDVEIFVSLDISPILGNVGGMRPSSVHPSRLRKMCGVVLVTYTSCLVVLNSPEEVFPENLITAAPRMDSGSAWLPAMGWPAIIAGSFHLSGIAISRCLIF